MDIVLREYQSQSVDLLREGYRGGHRSQILVSPTGSGKTVIAAYLMNEARKKGTRVAFVVDRVSLVDQTSAVLDQYRVDHGVIQAGHWRKRLYEPIQVCSAQTLEKRGFFPDLSLLVVDEAHAVRKETASLIKNRAEMRVLGLSATPLTKGLSELYSNVVNVTTTNKLIDEGYLVPLKVYAAVAPNMDGAKIVAGEWSEKDIEKRGNEIVGDIVAEWKDKTLKHFNGPVKTIVFAATVDHGAELCKQFQAQGFNFVQISYKDGSDERRRELIEEFRKPDSRIMGLVSCEVFTKGFDVPDVLCGISARPYRKSLSSHIQQLGRVMRPSPGKTFALWLDHSGNALRFHDDVTSIFEDGIKGLDDGALDNKARKEPDEKTVETIKCGACGFVMPPRAMVCPACGHEKPRRNMVETVAGQMVMIGGKSIQAAGKYEYLADPDRTWRQLAYLALDRKRGDVEAAQKFAQAQFKNLYGTFRRGHIRDVEAEPPSPKLASHIHSMVIRWAKARARQANG